MRPEEAGAARATAKGGREPRAGPEGVAPGQGKRGLASLRWRSGSLAHARIRAGPVSATAGEEPRSDARALIRDLLRSDADINPEEGPGVLEVRLHTLANPRSNRAIQHLLDHLNAAECVYPGTNLRLTYTLSSAPPTGSRCGVA